MRNVSSSVCNAAWRLVAWPAARQFAAACRCVGQTQQGILARIVSRNQTTRFGQRHYFSGIKGIRAFQQRVPLSDYESYRADIKQIQLGETGVLTADPVTLLQPSSGSTAATKLIPYNRSLHEEFLRAIRPWMHDLLTRWPGLRCGSAYWSISPGAAEPLGNGAIPVGFYHDIEYLGRMEKPFVQRLLVMPPEVRQIQDLDAFRYVTALFLLKDSTLSFVSVWNPSYLVLLLSRIPEWSDDLILDIARGDIRADIEIPDRIRHVLQKRIRPDRSRAETLRGVFAQRDQDRKPEVTGPSLYERIWPRLALISCWADGPSAGAVPGLKKLFPHVAIQPKGLVATEGVVSFPLIGQPGAVLAVNSHFLEFVPLSDHAPCEGAVPLLAHELCPGERYSVVMTTGGGLYRYRLRDIIEVTGFFRQCPLVRFIGKEDAILDMFGEKLHAHFVDNILRAVFARGDLEPEFYMLAPERERAGMSAHYVLYLKLRTQVPVEAMKRVETEMEEKLQENFHYRYCRKLGQLHASRVFVIHPQDNTQEKILRLYHRRGQSWGNIKTAVLGPGEGLAGEFAGFYLK